MYATLKALLLKFLLQNRMGVVENAVIWAQLLFTSPLLPSWGGWGTIFGPRFVEKPGLANVVSLSHTFYYDL